ncbi:hypothetical protein BDR07DRAFT_1297233 [Suillus spraguei]|nr:hypothetical protein BDR07DRAFT_1297233 [Suillus spraguei]
MPPAFLASDAPICRRIRATPERPALGWKAACPARFDMALILVGPCSPHVTVSAAGVEVAQVHVIFSHPHHFGKYSRTPAYIE